VAAQVGENGVVEPVKLVRCLQWKRESLIWLSCGAICHLDPSSDARGAWRAAEAAVAVAERRTICSVSKTRSSKPIQTVTAMILRRATLSEMAQSIRTHDCKLKKGRVKLKKGRAVTANADSLAIEELWF
jgi:hypothetical protein